MADGYTCPRCDWGGTKPAFNNGLPVCPYCQDNGVTSLLIPVNEAGP